MAAGAAAPKAHAVLLQRQSRSKVAQVASPLWGRGTFSFCSRLQGVSWLFLFSATQVLSKSKNVGWKPRFCIFPPNSTFIFFASPRPYTLRRATLHNEGFCVGFAHQTLHTKPFWLSNFKPQLCRVWRKCMYPWKTYRYERWIRAPRAWFLFIFFRRLPFFVQSGTNFASFAPLEVSASRKMLWPRDEPAPWKVFATNRSDVSPRDPSTRLSRARTLYSFIYTLSTLPMLPV